MDLPSRIGKVDFYILHAHIANASGGGGEPSGHIAGSTIDEYASDIAEKNIFNETRLMPSPYLKILAPITPKNTSLDGHVSGWAKSAIKIRPPGNDAIIERPNKRIANAHIFRSANINSICVISPAADDLDIFDGHILRLGAHNHRPARRIAEGNSSDRHIGGKGARKTGDGHTGTIKPVGDSSLYRRFTSGRIRVCTVKIRAIDYATAGYGNIFNPCD